MGYGYLVLTVSFWVKISSMPPTTAIRNRKFQSLTRGCEGAREVTERRKEIVYIYYVLYVNERYNAIQIGRVPANLYSILLFLDNYLV